MYGDPEVHSQPESYKENVNPSGVCSCYDEGKSCAESLFVNYHQQNNVRMMTTDDSVTIPINIVNSGEFPMLGLAREVLDITGSKMKIVYLPLPADDPVKRKPDISMAREKLGGWEPVASLREGLLKTIEYFDRLLSEGN